MSFKKAEKKETNTYVIEFQIEKADFDAANDRAFRKNAKNISIPGFRKGKAPRHLIEKMYGTGVFYEEAINDCLPAAYEEAAKASGLDIIGQPEFDITTIDENGVAMTAKVTTKPEVKIENYKGIKVTKDVKSVTAADVKAEIENVRSRNSREVEITDRAAKKDDIANIDFDGYVDGKQFDGGKAEGHSLVLGSGQFIPGFEDQIIGKNIGDEFDVNVTFPEDYGAKELAGKAAVFKVKLHEIKIKELPTVDDEFAKDVSEFDTLKELKADIKKKALERKQKAADEAVENALVQQIVDGIKGDIPEAMFENRLEQCVEDFAYRLQSQGLNLETYLKYTNSNIDEFKKSFRPQAEMQVKYRLALEKIVELENITPDEKDIEEQYKKMAEDYGVELEKVKAAIPASELSKDIAVGKAIDFIKENAVITEVEPKAKAEEEKKPAAKKTAAKKPAAKKTAAKKTEEKSAE